MKFLGKGSVNEENQWVSSLGITSPKLASKTFSKIEIKSGDNLIKIIEGVNNLARFL